MFYIQVKQKVRVHAKDGKPEQYPTYLPSTDTNIILCFQFIYMYNILY